jgi:hypothetical protein
MRGVQRAVSACGQGQHGSVMVRVSVAGPSGRVSNAEASGGMPPAVRSCVARAVRGAHFPPFRRSSMTINYPFRL